MNDEGTVVMGPEDVSRALRRMAGEIAERSRGTADLALVGIRRGGVPLAARLAALLQGMEGREVPVGAVDITLYRDDAGSALPSPRIGRSEVAFDVTTHTILLVDDVLFTGRTIRAAIDALLDYGRPPAIQLAVLVDRGHRELPIQADFVGLHLPTQRTEQVDVRLDPPGPDRVLLRHGT